MAVQDATVVAGEPTLAAPRAAAPQPRYASPSPVAGRRPAGGRGTSLNWRLRRVTAATSRAVRGFLSVVRPLGWLALGCGTGSIVLGLALGWAEVRLVGVGLLALAAAAALFMVGRSPFRVELRLTRSRVTRGEKAIGRIDVVNEGARATLPALIELPVGRGSATFALPRLARDGAHEELFQIPTERRAVIDVGPVRSVRGDALGLFARHLRWTDVQRLYVHPETVRLDAEFTGVLRDLEGQPTRDLSSSDVAFHALRDYVPGDDVRHIAWKSLAKTGQLMVRQFEETRRSHIALLLSLNRRDFGVDEDEFELAVSACASIALQALREDRDLTVLTGASRTRSETGMQVLDALSAVEMEPNEASLGALATATVKRAPGASLAVFVIGSRTSPADIAAAAQRLPIDARRLAVRCESGAVPARTAIGRTTAITIGSLEQLPRALFAVGV